MSIGTITELSESIKEISTKCVNKHMEKLQGEMFDRYHLGQYRAE